MEDLPLEWTLRLPVAVRPVQMPRLVSAGLAFSPFEASPDYSSTAPRTRALWLEFDAPPADPQDRYYARVLAQAPDPLLMRDEVVVTEPDETPLPIDAELLRLITPGQPADAAALHAMAPLSPPAGESPATTRHFLLPLPEGLGSSSPELFGFFVYEFRVGHDESRWSTAQARFGPPLRVAGVQHPAPPLACQIGRTADAIHVEAPYATPVLEGRNVRPRIPNTELWVLLYVQVMQVDGAARRNVLLERARAEPGSIPNSDQLHGDDLLLFGTVRFPQPVVLERLTALGLPESAPLSVLAVELLPEPTAERFPDPLGGDLGRVRVLRTSPLQPVPAIC
jgi:hypothetical protein